MSKRKTNKSSSKPGPRTGSGALRPHVSAGNAPQKAGKIALSLALFLLTTAVFLPSLINGFVNYDDQDYVTENAYVRRGVTGETVAWVWQARVSANWHPLTLLSHMLDCQLFGLHPWGHHLTSVLLHALNATLLFLLLCRMTGALWPGLVVAALSGLHPLRVESVAWVSERKDVLSGLFWMLTLLAYVSYAEQSKIKTPAPKIFYGLALLCFGLGLLAKPMLVTLPFVLLLLDYWPLNRIVECGVRSAESKPSQERFSPVPLVWAVLEKVPFFVLAVASSVITFLVQKNAGAVSNTESFPLPDRLHNALLSYGRYLGKLAWPANLCVFYPYKAHQGFLTVLPAIVLLGAVTILVLVFGRKRAYLPVGWFWFVGTLVPVIGLVQVGQQAMADRYTYLPGIGVFIMLVWGARELEERWRQPVLALACAAAVLIAFGTLTVRQINYWKDSESLFRHALAVSKDNWLAHNNLGSALDQQGKLDEAIAQYQIAIKLRPDYALAHNNLGVDWDHEGHLDQAIGELQTALSINPKYAGAHCNLGNSLFQAGRTDEALGQYHEALKLNPEYPDPHTGMGNLFKGLGRLDEAINEFEAALKLQPDNITAHVGLGNVFLQQARLDKALGQFRAAQMLQPNDPLIYYNAGITLLQMGRVDEAATQFEQSLKLNPGNALVHQMLGNILAHQGKMAPALEHFETAVSLEPNSPQAHYYFGLILLQINRRKEAAAQFGEALRLQPDYTEAAQQLRGLTPSSQP